MILKYFPFAILSLFVIACTGATESSDSHEHHHHHTDAEATEVEVSSEQMDVVGIELGKIEQKSLTNGVNVVGVLAVDANNYAEATPLIAGVIANIPVVEGQAVYRGQVVAYIEAPEVLSYQQEYLRSEEELAITTREFERQEKLYTAGAGSLKNFQLAQSAMQTSQVAAQVARQQLIILGIDPSTIESSKMTARVAVSAPISGIVTEIRASIGSYADMQTPLLSIANNSAIYARLQIFEKDIANISSGESVSMRLTGNSSETFDGVVESINKTIDANSRAFSVRVSLNKPIKGNLAPGMAVTAFINTSMANLPALPDDAIVASAGHYYVFQLEEHHNHDAEEAQEEHSTEHDHYDFKKVEVIPGAKSMGYTAVTFPGGIPSEDALFVVKGAFYLSSMSSDHGEHNH